VLGAAAVLAFFALVALILASSRRLAGHRLAATGHLMLAGTCAVGAGLLWLLATDLATYRPVDEQQPIAELFLEQTGSRQFRATLTRLPEGRMQMFVLSGDHWRLDARTLDWTREAARLGLKPHYRIDRLNARDSSRETTAGESVSGYALGMESRADVWSRARDGSTLDRWIEAQRAYGPWRPMAHRARFEVRLRDGRLDAEPANDPTAAGLASGS
jgi:hypothetical protein